MNRVLPILVATIALASGCFGFGGKDEATPTPTPTPPDPRYDVAREQLANTTCPAPAVSTTATSPNVKVLGSASAPDASGRTVYGELAVNDTFAVVAYFTSTGFGYLNLTNPSTPKSQPPAYVYTPTIVLAGSSSSQPVRSTFDVKLNRDGTVALIGLSDRIVAVDLTAKPFFPRSVLMHPSEFRGFAYKLALQPEGPVEYVWAASGGFNAGLMVAKLSGSGIAAKLETVKVYTSPPPGPQAVAQLAPRDLYISRESLPDGDHTFLYMANGYGGILVWNVDNPANAVPVATHPSTVGSPPRSLVPTLYAGIQAKWIDGKRIVVTTSESGYNTVKVWDFTDFKAPKLVSEWLFDANQPGRPERSVQVVNGTLLVAHYLEGLFGFDLRPLVADAKAPFTPVLHYQPNTGGSTVDVVVRRGIVYVSDASFGVTALGYGCFAPGDPALTSDG